MDRSGIARGEKPGRDRSKEQPAGRHFGCDEEADGRVVSEEASNAPHGSAVKVVRGQVSGSIIVLQTVCP